MSSHQHSLALTPRLQLVVPECWGMRPPTLTNIGIDTVPVACDAKVLGDEFPPTPTGIGTVFAAGSARVMGDVSLPTFTNVDVVAAAGGGSTYIDGTNPPALIDGPMGW